MSIFEITGDGAVKLEPAGPSAYGVSERAGLQRLLRSQVDIVAPDVLVVGEDVGAGSGAARPIDLLGVDKGGHLVVIDLECADDRGQLELQAVRHAAMLSAMTFDEVTGIFSAHLAALGNDDSARDLLLAFMNRDTPPDNGFAGDVRIVLAAADFSPEVTRSVLWLNARGLDIRCVRLRPYTGGTRQFLDVQQIVPVPAAAAAAPPVPANESAPASRAIETAPEKPLDQPGPVHSVSGSLWFVNVGMDDPEEKPMDASGRGNIRHWDNCVRHGYLSAGGGARYIDALRKLEPGAHVVAYQKGEGYVGYGIVTQPAQAIEKFRLEEGGTLAAALKQNGHSRADDEYAVGVAWRKTFPLNNAKWFKGGFANQSTVCRLNDAETVAFLSAEFGIPVEGAGL